MMSSSCFSAVVLAAVVAVVLVSALVQAKSSSSSLSSVSSRRRRNAKKYAATTKAFGNNNNIHHRRDIQEIRQQKQYQQQQTSSQRDLQDALSIGSYLASTGVHTLLLSGNANLLDLLSNATDGPFTLFAPNDMVFTLDPDVDYLLTLLSDPSYLVHLQTFLGYHLVDGSSITNADLIAANGQTLTMSNFENVTVAVNGTVTTLMFPYPTAQAMARLTNDPLDAAMSNGIVQGIDAVLRPSFLYYYTAVDVTLLQPQLSTFSQLLVYADLEEQFMSSSSSSGYTVLCPTNDAFAKLEAATDLSVEYLTYPENLNTLVYLLHHHFIPGPALLSYFSFETGQVLQPMDGPDIIVSVSTVDGTISFDNGTAVLVSGDLLARTSILHTIDSLLVPDLQSMPTAAPVVGATLSPSYVSLTGDTTMNETSSSSIFDSNYETAPTMAPFDTTNDSLGSYIQKDTRYAALSTALFVANLAETLTTPALNWTVFGPDTASFATSLSPEMANRLLGNTGYITHLTNLLSYHVYSSGILEQSDWTSTAAAAGLADFTMLNGEIIRILIPVVDPFPSSNATTTPAAANTAIFTNDAGERFATLARPDIGVSNGIFHGIIDGIFKPSFFYQTVVQKIVSMGEVGVFSQLINDAGLSDLLQSGEFTVFAPVNDAFNNVPAEVMAEISDPSNIVKLQQVLLFHVLPIVVPSVQAVPGDYTTSQGGNILLSITEDGTIVLNNVSAVITADLLAENGIVHTIDTVLIPDFTTLWPTPAASPPPTSSLMPTSSLNPISAAPSPVPVPGYPTFSPATRSGLNTIAGILESDQKYIALVTALQYAGLFNITQDESSKITFFAPSNDAFSSVDPDLVEKILENPGYILHAQNLFSYHITPGDYVPDQLADGTLLPMLNGETITVNFTSIDSLGFPTKSLGNGDVNFASIFGNVLIASNGFVYQLEDGVLLPSFVQNDILAKVEDEDGEFSGELSTFYELITIAGLEDAFSADSLTILAPTNEAFENLPPGILESIKNPADVKDLQSALLSHIIPSVNPSSLLRNRSYFPVEGSAINVSILTTTTTTTVVDSNSSDAGVEVKFNDATVVQADVLASNGILHLVNAVLVPFHSTQAPTSVPTTVPTLPPAASPTVVPADSTRSPVATTPSPPPPSAAATSKCITTSASLLLVSIVLATFA